MPGDALFLRGSPAGIPRLRAGRRARWEPPQFPAEAQLSNLDRAIDLLVEMKNISETAVGLAYSALVLADLGLAAEVRHLEDRLDEMKDHLELWVLRASSEDPFVDPSPLRGLLRLSQAAEDLGDAAQQMVWLVEKQEEMHPILAIALGESDEVVVRVPVGEGSPADGARLAEPARRRPRVPRPGRAPGRALPLPAPRPRGAAGRRRADRQRARRGPPTPRHPPGGAWRRTRTPARSAWSRSRRPAADPSAPRRARRRSGAGVGGRRRRTGPAAQVADPASSSYGGSERAVVLGAVPSPGGIERVLGVGVDPSYGGIDRTVAPVGAAIGRRGRLPRRPCRPEGCRCRELGDGGERPGEPGQLWWAPRSWWPGRRPSSAASRGT